MACVPPPPWWLARNAGEEDAFEALCAELCAALCERLTAEHRQALHGLTRAGGDGSRPRVVREEAAVQAIPPPPHHEQDSESGHGESHPPLEAPAYDEDEDTEVPDEEPEEDYEDWEPTCPSGGSRISQRVSVAMSRNSNMSMVVSGVRSELSRSSSGIPYLTRPRHTITTGTRMDTMGSAEAAETPFEKAASPIEAAAGSGVVKKSVVQGVPTQRRRVSIDEGQSSSRSSPTRPSGTSDKQAADSLFHSGELPSREQIDGLPKRISVGTADSLPPALASLADAGLIPAEGYDAPMGASSILGSQPMRAAAEKLQPPRGTRAVEEAAAPERPGRGTAVAEEGAAFEELARARRLQQVSIVEQADSVLRTKALAHSAMVFDDHFFEEGDVEEAANTILCGSCQRRAQRFAQSAAFEIFISMTILTNSVFLGVETEWNIEHTDMDPPLAFFFVGHAYNLVFVFELCLRMFAYGRRFFFGPMWEWNWLDVFIVAASLLEMVTDLMYLVSESKAGNLQNINTVRLLRLTRIAKMVRLLRIARILKFFRALRTLVYQIINTMKSVFWALVLLLVIVYVFGLIFVQTVTDFLENKDIEDYDMLIQYWGSLPRTMFTLYKSVTQGVNWQDALYPLLDVSWVAVGLFLVYVTFVMFAVLNTVTGVFCQKAIESANHDHDNQIRDQILEKAMYMKKTRELFQQMDTDQTDCITYQQFETHMRDEKVLAYFAIMGLDHNDAWDLFRLLDSDRNALVDQEEFVGGFMRLRGTAKSIDVAKLSYENKQMRARLAAFMGNVETLLAKMLQPDEATVQDVYKLQGQQLTLQPSRAVKSTPPTSAGSAMLPAEWV